LLDTFKRADNVLFQAVKGISDLIVFEGLVNVDFADVRAVMSEMGMAMMGTGEGSGENRALEAAEKAISSPLLEDISISGAKGILINVTASPDVTLQEINEAAAIVHAEAHEDANIIWGMVIGHDLEDQIRVTVIATGFGEEESLRRGEDTSRRLTTTTGLGTSSSLSGMGNVGGVGATMNLSSEIGSNLGQRKQSTAEVVKIKKLSVLGGGSDEERFDIPTFLRKPSE
jgi:cell division protein FtsZ